MFTATMHPYAREVIDPACEPTVMISPCNPEGMLHSDVMFVVTLALMSVVLVAGLVSLVWPRHWWNRRRG